MQYQPGRENYAGQVRLCPFCKAPAPGQQCPSCHLDTTAPRRPCPTCGQMVPSQYKVCWNCGRKFKSEMQWKVPLIILIFILCFIISILISVLSR